MSLLKNKKFSDVIIDWYRQNKRDLPWRGTTDPYAVWLSEIILQQTRVQQGLPYYQLFLKKYKNVTQLANANEQEVLRLWQGLGYYSRARNLHKCAKQVVIKYEGKFPSSFHELKKLQGIGEYTAAAIASICYKEPVGVVDGNVYRVLSRVFGIDTPINSSRGKQEFFKLANSLISPTHPDEHNQAIMEFGALYCVPKNPKCNECVFSKMCVANINNSVSVLPVKKRKEDVKRRFFYYLVWQDGEKLFLKKRTGKDIWHGLYDFELIEKSRTMSEKKIALEIGTKKFTISSPYKHVLSHQLITARFILLKNTMHKKLYTFKQIARLPKPVLISRFLNDHFGFL